MYKHFYHNKDFWIELCSINSSYINNAPKCFKLDTNFLEEILIKLYNKYDENVIEWKKRYDYTKVSFRNYYLICHMIIRKLKNTSNISDIKDVINLKYGRSLRSISLVDTDKYNILYRFIKLNINKFILNISKKIQLNLENNYMMLFKYNIPIFQHALSIIPQVLLSNKEVTLSYLHYNIHNFEMYKIIPKILELFKYDEDIIIACLKKYKYFYNTSLYKLSILSNNNKNVILEYFNQNNRIYYYLSEARYIIHPDWYDYKKYEKIHKYEDNTKYIDNLRCVDELYNNDSEILYRIHEYDDYYIEWMSKFQKTQVDNYYNQLYSQIVFLY